MIFIDVLNYSFGFIAAGFISYYLLISLFALRANKENDYSTVKIRKFAVILFAQDKKQMLSRLLYSVSGLVYPKNKYDLIVVADNYSDVFVKAAEKLGAKVMVPAVDQQERNKKNVLPWVFDTILREDESYDAVIIFNSDSLVSGNYLEVMNYYLEQGVEVLQGSYHNLHPPEKWLDKIFEVDFLLESLVFPMGWKVLGLGTTLRSNGICFSTASLRKFPWEITQQQSIVDYGLYLRLKGVKVDFAANAIVFTNILPDNGARTNYSGDLIGDHYKFRKRYVPRFLSTILKVKSFKHIDLLLNLVFPSFANTMLFVVMMGVINVVLWGVGWIPLSVLLFWLIIIGIAMANISVTLIIAGRQQKFLKTVMYVPVNIYLKIQLLFKKAWEAEQLIENSEGETEFLGLPDENQPVQ